MKGDVSASRLACACVIIGCWQRHSGCKRGRGRWLQQMHGRVFRFPSFQEADEAKQRFPLATPPLKMHPFDGASRGARRVAVDRSPRRWPSRTFDGETFARSDGRLRFFRVSSEASELFQDCLSLLLHVNWRAKPPRFKFPLFAFN